jgi:hypothetical protein
MDRIQNTGHRIQGGNQNISTVRCPVEVSGGRISGKQYIRIFFIYDLRYLWHKLTNVNDESKMEDVLLSVIILLKLLISLWVLCLLAAYKHV